ncbi:MAG: hypothetical protein H0V35_00630 [Nitrospira sp.]|nr:hypothetical protein [Nitrospira sp.]
MEDKTYSLTFHYRQASSSQVAREVIFHTAGLLSPRAAARAGKIGREYHSTRQPAQGVSHVGINAQLQRSAALYVGVEDVFSLPDERIVSVRIGKKAASAANHSILNGSPRWVCY